MKVPFIANIWGLWHLQGTEYTVMSERMSRMGLQKNWGKLFSHREFLSQKGQSLVADTKGNSTWSPCMIGCTQNWWNCSVTMNSYSNQNFHFKFIAAFQRVRLNLKMGGVSIGTALMFSRTHKVMARRPTCTWAFKCCSSKPPMQKKEELLIGSGDYLYWFFIFSVYLPLNWVSIHSFLLKWKNCMLQPLHKVSNTVSH